MEITTVCRFCLEPIVLQTEDGNNIVVKAVHVDCALIEAL